MIYKDIAEYIENGFSEFRIGKSLFINQAPSTPDFLALIRDDAGGFEINGEMRTERKGSFKLVVRTDKYESGYNIAVQLSDFLTLNNVVMGEYLVKILRPKHEPISYQISEANLYEISMNFSIIYGIVQ